jgi:hypothetical protein
VYRRLYEELIIRGLRAVVAAAQKAALEGSQRQPRAYVRARTSPGPEGYDLPGTLNSGSASLVNQLCAGGLVANSLSPESDSVMSGAQSDAGDSTSDVTLKELAQQFEAGDLNTNLAFDRITRCYTILLDFCEAAVAKQTVVVVYIMPPSFWAGGYSTDPAVVLEPLCCGADAVRLAEDTVEQGGRQLLDWVSHMMRCANEAPGAGSVRLCPLVLCDGQQVSAHLVLFRVLLLHMVAYYVYVSSSVIKCRSLC